MSQDQNNCQVINISMQKERYILVKQDVKHLWQVAPNNHWLQIVFLTTLTTMPQTQGRLGKIRILAYLMAIRKALQLLKLERLANLDYCSIIVRCVIYTRKNPAQIRMFVSFRGC